MELRTITLHPEPTPARGFFLLPGDLRNIIYDLVLVEPPRHEKRHSPFCDAGAKDTGLYECPPFATGGSVSGASICPCAFRQGLSLLATNRQIHAEAASLFWTSNTFCWTDLAGFVNRMAELREERRRQIRHVSIDNGVTGVTCHYRSGSYHRDRTCDRFWQMLFTCTGLRTLEMRVEWAGIHADDAPNLKRHCPHLQSVHFAKLFKYDLNGDRPSSYTTAPPATLWIKAVKEVPLAQLSDATACKETSRLLETNFFVHAEWAIHTQILNQPTSRFRLPIGLPRPVLAAHLVDLPPPQRVALRDGSETEVHVYGLPISRATRYRHWRQRVVRDEMLRRAGKLTRRQEELKREVEEIKVRNRESRRASEERRVGGIAEWRKQLKVRYRLENEEEEKREKEREDEEFEKMVQEAKLLKVSERKRRSRSPR